MYQQIFQTENGVSIKCITGNLLILGTSLSNPNHPAGTSKESDKCDLSKDSEIAPLTLGSMDNSYFTTYFVSHRKAI